MVDRRDVEQGIELVDRHGRAVTHRRGPGVALVVFSGVAGAEFAPLLTHWLDTEIAAHGSLAFFADAEDLSSYHTGFRKHFTDWLQTNRPALGTVHALVASRVVQMGITLVNPLVGNFIKAYSSRSSFEQELEEAQAGRAR